MIYLAHSAEMQEGHQAITIELNQDMLVVMLCEPTLVHALFGWAEACRIAKNGGDAYIVVNTDDYERGEYLHIGHTLAEEDET